MSMTKVAAGKKMTSVRVDEKLARDVRVLAARLGMTLERLHEDALREFLARRKA
jgi:predicted transcriptional regulator